MLVKVNETNELVELVYRQNGVNFADEIIGHSGAMDDDQFSWDKESDIYSADQGTVEWWQNHLDKLSAADDALADAASEFGVPAWEIIKHISADTDVADVPAAIMNAIEAFVR